VSPSATVPSWQLRQSLLLSVVWGTPAGLDSVGLEYGRGVVSGFNGRFHNGVLPSARCGVWQKKQSWFADAAFLSALLVALKSCGELRRCEILPAGRLGTVCPVTSTLSARGMPIHARLMAALPEARRLPDADSEILRCGAERRRLRIHDPRHQW